MANPLYQTQSILAVPNRVFLVYDQLHDIEDDNYVLYLGIGGTTPWASGDADILPPLETTDYLNQVRRNLVALKQVYVADAIPVVQRVDWVANTHYSAYSNSSAMYAYTKTANANGTATVNSGNNIVVGTNTTFMLDFQVNQLITLPGDGVYVNPQTREIINVASNTLLTVNNAFTANYTANIPQTTSNSFPYYAQNFYVRNAYDQVFICLANNFGVISTDMPKISLGGQLPTNPYIIAADGYLWKYLYTISGGYKQQFFTDQWMPVIQDTNVAASANDGRLDIINIIAGGTGYNGNTASFSVPIITIIGDGTGANVTAQVSANGTITGLNIINGGVGYTKATVTANGGTTGSGANLQAVIGPPGGWGSNAAIELGATTLMISVNLTDTESNTIPTVDSLGENFTYRQISLIGAPKFSNTVLGTANALNYDMTTTLTMSSNINFMMNDIVFQSPNPPYDFANATFSATVVYFNSTSLVLHINNLSGTISPTLPLFAARSAGGNVYSQIVSFNETSPLLNIFSGQTRYVENRAAVTRTPGQAENIKIILQF